MVAVDGFHGEYPTDQEGEDAEEGPEGGNEEDAEDGEDEVEKGEGGGDGDDKDDEAKGGEQDELEDKEMEGAQGGDGQEGEGEESEGDGDEDTGGGVTEVLGTRGMPKKQSGTMRSNREVRRSIRKQSTRKRRRSATPSKGAVDDWKDFHPAMGGVIDTDIESDEEGLKSPTKQLRKKPKLS